MKKLGDLRCDVLMQIACALTKLGRIPLLRTPSFMETLQEETKTFATLQQQNQLPH
jgi:hypothetical protein